MTITVPNDVEISWALITPKKRTSAKIKHIALASVYFSSKFTNKSLFVDHISESYHLLCAKYGSDLKFIIGGDMNRFNLKPILSLSCDLKQVVTVPTRKNPDAIIDKIITNIPTLYQSPFTLPPLENDEHKSGQPSDHLIVCMRPISNAFQSREKRWKIIKYRPFPESGIREMGRWIQSQSWDEIYRISCPNQKAITFEKILLDKVNLIFPEKYIRINENDKPWVDAKLLKIDRARKREYSKRKKSEKWIKLNDLFQERASVLKKTYYRDMVEDLKTSNVSQWYSKVKRMSSIDLTKDEGTEVHDLMHLPISAQAEKIADQFAEISNQYDAIKSENISIPNMESSKPHPLFEQHQIHEKIQKMRKKSSAVPGDIPWRILREFSVELSAPLSNIFNSCTLEGVWPELWKEEYVTPAPKVYPPKNTDDLRKISMTRNLSKIYEALLAESIVADISSNKDPSQFGNERGLSITHYLVKMLHKILSILDTNNQKDKFAVLAQLVDWSKAFDRQDHTLGIQSFIRSGVRPTLIPVLVSFFQNRKMIVKWKDHLSTTRDLPGGGPQGSTLGLLEYDVNSDSNADHVPVDMKFKFVDDLSTLELINLILVGLSSYNFRHHVASDVGIDDSFLPSANLNAQKSLDMLESWTNSNKMKLNVKKTNYMVFNFTENMQFTTRLYLENTLLESVKETKLLGTIITTDLKWHKNTHMLVCKAYGRMTILHKLSQFDVSREDMVTIYILYIRSILEQNCQVWHHSLSQEDQTDLERVQKIAFRIILGKEYDSYEDSLIILSLQTLHQRRELLCLRFAKKCIKHPKAASMFPLNRDKSHSLRNQETYYVQPARTGRLMNSAIPQMQRALNRDASGQRKPKI